MAQNVQNLLGIPMPIIVFVFYVFYACEHSHLARYIRSSYRVQFLELAILRCKNGVPCKPTIDHEIGLDSAEDVSTEAAEIGLKCNWRKEYDTVLFLT